MGWISCYRNFYQPGWLGYISPITSQNGGISAYENPSFLVCVTALLRWNRAWSVMTCYFHKHLSVSVNNSFVTIVCQWMNTIKYGRPIWNLLCGNNRHYGGNIYSVYSSTTLFAVDRYFYANLCLCWNVVCQAWRVKGEGCMVFVP